MKQDDNVKIQNLITDKLPLIVDEFKKLCISAKTNQDNTASHCFEIMEEQISFKINPEDEMTFYANKAKFSVAYALKRAIDSVLPNNEETYDYLKLGDHGADRFMIGVQTTYNENSQEELQVYMRAWFYDDAGMKVYITGNAEDPSIHVSFTEEQLREMRSVIPVLPEELYTYVATSAEKVVDNVPQNYNLALSEEQILIKPEMIEGHILIDKDKQVSCLNSIDKIEKADLVSYTERNLSREDWESERRSHMSLSDKIREAKEECINKIKRRMTPENAKEDLNI